MIEYKELLLKQKAIVREELLLTTENKEVSKLMLLLKCVNMQLNALS